jgi:tRNA (guanosine-2'-O-)-methyltransferase
VATTPHKNDHTISTLQVKNKLALVFGTEIEGISDEVKALADDFVKIPMFGFTESFNVSVCAALCMYELMKRIRKSIPGHGLTDQEKLDVHFEWMKNSVDKGEALIRDYFEKKDKD